jgi:hypothetical protein
MGASTESLRRSSAQLISGAGAKLIGLGTNPFKDVFRASGTSR